jgi:hypothetical protein
MNRREFLIGSTVAFTAARRVWGQAPDRAKKDL